MERAISSVSVERGYDPRDFALVAFGGCGGLHACEIADDLGIQTFVVPQHAGVLSALGMLMCRSGARLYGGRTRPDRSFDALEDAARKDMRKPRWSDSSDMRYVGQSYEITVAGGRDLPRGASPSMYGYSDEKRETEIVTIRLRAVDPCRPRLTHLVNEKQKPVTGPALACGLWAPRFGFRPAGAAVSTAQESADYRKLNRTSHPDRLILQQFHQTPDRERMICSTPTPLQADDRARPDHLYVRARSSRC